MAEGDGHPSPDDGELAVVPLDKAVKNPARPWCRCRPGIARTPNWRRVRLAEKLGSQVKGQVRRQTARIRPMISGPPRLREVEHGGPRSGMGTSPRQKTQGQADARRTPCRSRTVWR